MCSSRAVGGLPDEELFAFRGTRVISVPGRFPGPAHPLRQAASCRRTEPLHGTADSAGNVMADWQEKLQSIIRSLPSFAIWQIEPLERCFVQYCNLLQQASRDVRLRRSCVELMANAEHISETLCLVKRNRQWQPFNRAAFELRQDCELLCSAIGNLREDLEA